MIVKSFEISEDVFDRQFHTRIFERAYCPRPSNVSNVADGRITYLLGQRVRDPLSLLHPIPSGDRLWYSRFVPTISARIEETEQWEEAIKPINFSHTNRTAWRTISKLTGRSGHSSRLCPVSANSITSQLVENRANRTDGCESIMLVNKELSDLWEIPAPEGHSISEPFRPEELALLSDTRSQGRSRDCIPSSQSLYSTPGRLSNLGFATSSLLACANSKFQRFGEEQW